MLNKYKSFFPFSIKDTFISLAIIIVACLICISLRPFSNNDFHVPLIFILAVAFISSLTNGFFYGMISSIISVFCVNYIFTYPYLAFNFTISGYPLTFISMLTVSIIICALTSQIKWQEKVNIENEKEKIRANLLRAISHDLRTPLTSIIGSMAAISENIDSLSKEKQLELLADAREDAQWLIRIVENLLSITRISDRAAEIKKEAEAVEEVIAEAVSKFRKQYSEIPVIITIPEELLVVPMDAILIEQVIINLLDNSVSHGQHTTKIHLKVVQDGNWALFSVEDNGSGFSEKVRLNFLENHITLSQDRNVADNRRNMGIGLSVCMAIIKAHGGTMSAETVSQGGAIIKFSLPLRED